MCTKLNSKEIDDLLRTTATFNEFKPGYTEVDGFQLGYRYNEIANDVESLEVNDSDVWVCTYPKCGTTWTQEMVWLLVNNLDFKGAEVSLHNRFPFIEFESITDYQAFEKATGTTAPECMKNSVAYVKNLKTNPHCIKTHLPWNLLPKAIRNKDKRPKIINVARNPKDVCVSYYHHHKMLHGYIGTFEEFATLFLHDQLLWSPYWKHLESYWEQRNEPNVLILTYEDMKRDLRSVIAKISEFLNVPVPQGTKLEALEKHLRFDSMQANKSVNNTRVGAKQGEFFRKGIIGDHRNLMTPEIEATFDKWINDNNKIGISFDI